MDSSATSKIVTLHPALGLESLESRRLGQFGLRNAFFILLGDMFCLSLASAIAILFRSLIADSVLGRFLSLTSSIWLSDHLILLSLILAFPLIYALRGLYPGVGLGAVEELRRLSITTSMVFVTLASTSFFLRAPKGLSRSALLMAWVLSLLLVPIGRAFTRRLLCHWKLWGEPVAVIGNPGLCRQVLATLNSRPLVGLRPVVCYPVGVGAEPIDNTPIVHSMQDLLSAQRDMSIRSAIIADYLYRNSCAGEYAALEAIFPRCILVTGRDGGDLAWVSAVDLGGLIGLEVRNNLLNPWSQFQKRIIDFILGFVLGAFAAPLGALIALAIKLDSPGPIFFAQARIGKGGKTFRMFKFRTMYCDAEERLAEILRQDPKRRREWEKYQKLRDDPRVTRVGRILRKFSLDELPQFINVLRGEMSLVGPRPFFPDQKDLYGKSLWHYARVRPGITGLWQTSARNDATFQQRVALDERYVRNWSIWLDIYILAKTPWVVLSRRGAY
jgi:Undecaprenyl-phosphate galactose phosphotransferase WbaP